MSRHRPSSSSKRTTGPAAPAGAPRSTSSGAETRRLEACGSDGLPWRRWGPYLSRRPVFAAAEKFQNDPHWRDWLLFYEYFHGDNGAGIGASHQTGWTGLIAFLLRYFGRMQASDALHGDYLLAQPTDGI